MSIFTWGVNALVTAKPEPTPERFNPRPPGVIREGSATAAVLAFLLSHRGKRFSAYQVIHATGCTTKATSWALVYLQRQGLIDATSDPRNERYQRYECNEKTESAQISEPRTQEGNKGLAGNGPPLRKQKPEGLEVLRGKGNLCVSGVDQELSAVSAGYGPAAKSGPLAGQKGHKRTFHTRQLPLDNTGRADAQESVLSPGSGGRSCDDCQRGESVARHANPKCSGAQVDIRPEAQGQRCDVQITEMADLSGKDAAFDGLGAESGHTPRPTLSATAKGHADRQGS